MRDLSTTSSDKLPVIGLTGGIGSGKSTVAGIFRSFGVPTFDADEAAKSLYASNADLCRWIVREFGKECGLWKADQLKGINRSALGKIVFNDSAALSKLNHHVHPLVRQTFNEWVHLQLIAEAPYVIREAAILIESGSALSCDAVIAVEAPEILRIHRASRRLKVDSTAIQNRMKNQLNDEERRNRADFIIQNDTQDEVLPQALKIHHHILKQFPRMHTVD